MKKLILISALLFSFNGWAEEEFPIEFTCEVDSSIIYFSLSKDVSQSWWTPHDSSGDAMKNGRNDRFFWQKDKYKGQKNEISEIRIFPEGIGFMLEGGRGLYMWLFLNRKTLRGSLTGNEEAHFNVLCFKGHKSYGDNLI